MYSSSRSSHPSSTELTGKLREYVDRCSNSEKLFDYATLRSLYYYLGSGNYELSSNSFEDFFVFFNQAERKLNKTPDLDSKIIWSGKYILEPLLQTLENFNPEDNDSLSSAQVASFLLFYYQKWLCYVITNTPPSQIKNFKDILKDLDESSSKYHVDAKKILKLVFLPRIYEKNNSLISSVEVERLSTRESIMLCSASVWNADSSNSLTGHWSNILLAVSRDKNKLRSFLTKKRNFLQYLCLSPAQEYLGGLNQVDRTIFSIFSFEHWYQYVQPIHPNILYACLNSSKKIAGQLMKNSSSFIWLISRYPSTENIWWGVLIHKCFESLSINSGAPWTDSGKIGTYYTYYRQLTYGEPADRLAMLKSIQLYLPLSDKMQKILRGYGVSFAEFEIDEIFQQAEPYLLGQEDVNSQLQPCSLAQKLSGSQYGLVFWRSLENSPLESRNRLISLISRQKNLINLEWFIQPVCAVQNQATPDEIRQQFQILSRLIGIAKFQELITEDFLENILKNQEYSTMLLSPEAWSMQSDQFIEKILTPITQLVSKNSVYLPKWKELMNQFQPSLSDVRIAKNSLQKLMGRRDLSADVYQHLSQTIAAFDELHKNKRTEKVFYEIIHQFKALIAIPVGAVAMAGAMLVSFVIKLAPSTSKDDLIRQYHQDVACVRNRVVESQTSQVSVNLTLQTYRKLLAKIWFGAFILKFLDLLNDVVFKNLRGSLPQIESPKIPISQERKKLEIYWKKPICFKRNHDLVKDQKDALEPQNPSSPALKN